MGHYEENGWRSQTFPSGINQVSGYLGWLWLPGCSSYKLFFGLKTRQSFIHSLRQPSIKGQCATPRILTDPFSQILLRRLHPFRWLYIKPWISCRRLRHVLFLFAHIEQKISSSLPSGSMILLRQNGLIILFSATAAPPHAENHRVRVWWVNYHHQEIHWRKIIAQGRRFIMFPAISEMQFTIWCDNLFWLQYMRKKFPALCMRAKLSQASMTEERLFYRDSPSGI